MRKILTTKKGSILEEKEGKCRIIYNADEFEFEMVKGCKLEDIRKDLRRHVLT